MGSSRTSLIEVVREALSPGVRVIIVLGLVASVVVGVRRGLKTDDTTMWVFSRMHYRMYEPFVEEWNRTHDDDVQLTLMSIPALERRVMGGFMSGIPTAELIEVERRMAGRAFAGPLSTVGFVDLTERLASEGLLDRINAPSFSPWTSRHRIFGLPHDVHPVLLCYRADLVEAAGIDVSTIETWSDFAEAMRPLMADKDGDGNPDRYLMSFWPSHVDALEVFLLQAGGGFFNEAGDPIIDSEQNARTIARLATWCEGPGRIAADAPEFSAAGNRLKLDGYVIAAIMPDWLCNFWRSDVPELAGKLKLMPLPAAYPGGPRTSVWGGTMLGIPRSADNFEELWDFANTLYFSDELARTLYREGDIITPIKDHWSDPIFDEPDPFFSGQAKGRLYIEQAPHVPLRHASPFHILARDRVQDSLIRLISHARVHGYESQEDLEPEALRLLQGAQGYVERHMARTAALRNAES